MSHFVVLAIGENFQEQLQKYNENNISPYETINDWIKNYNEKSTIKIYNNKTKKIYDYFDKNFWIYLNTEDLEKIKGKSVLEYDDILQTKVEKLDDEDFYRKLVLPENYCTKYIPVKDVYSFKEYLVEKNEFKICNNKEEEETCIEEEQRYVTLDNKGDINKVIEFYNPNAKWDWYTIGGRWDGFLQTKNQEVMTLFLENEKFPSWIPESYKTTKNFPILVVRENIKQFIKAADLKENDIIMIEGKERKIEKIQHNDLVNQTFVENIDFEPMIQEYEIKLKMDWDKAQKILQKYLSIDEDKIIHELFKNKLYYDLEDYQMDQKDFVNKYKYDNFIPYALLDEDGNWYSKGKMGWWGMSDNKIDIMEWQKQVMDKLQSLKPGTLVTVIDCHI